MITYHAPLRILWTSFVGLMLITSTAVHAAGGIGNKTPLASLSSRAHRRVAAGSFRPAAHVQAGLGGSNSPSPFDSHQAVNSVPASLLKQVEGNDNMRRKFEHLCRTAQANICQELERLDGGATFRTDSWVRPDGGGGISRVLSKGKVFEKAGVNLSVVYGNMPQVRLFECHCELPIALAVIIICFIRKR